VYNKSKYLPAIPPTPRTRAEKVKKLFCCIDFLHECHKDRKEIFYEQAGDQIRDLWRITQYQKDNGELPWQK